MVAGKAQILGMQMTWPSLFTFISTNECLLYIMGAETVSFRRFCDCTKVSKFFFCLNLLKSTYNLKKNFIGIKKNRQ